MRGYYSYDDDDDDDNGYSQPSPREGSQLDGRGALFWICAFTEDQEYVHMFMVMMMMMIIMLITAIALQGITY